MPKKEKSENSGEWTAIFLFSGTGCTIFASRKLGVKNRKKIDEAKEKFNQIINDPEWSDYYGNPLIYAKLAFILDEKTTPKRLKKN